MSKSSVSPLLDGPGRIVGRGNVNAEAPRGSVWQLGGLRPLSYARLHSQASSFPFPTLRGHQGHCLTGPGWNSEAWAHPYPQPYLLPGNFPRPAPKVAGVGGGHTGCGSGLSCCDLIKGHSSCCWQNQPRQPPSGRALPLSESVF